MLSKEHTNCFFEPGEELPTREQVMGAYVKLIYCVRGVESVGRGRKQFVLLEIAHIGTPGKLCIPHTRAKEVWQQEMKGPLRL